MIPLALPQRSVARPDTLPLRILGRDPDIEKRVAECLMTSVSRHPWRNLVEIPCVDAGMCRDWAWSAECARLRAGDASLLSFVLATPFVADAFSRKNPLLVSYVFPH